jgi:beta-lactamase class D
MAANPALKLTAAVLAVGISGCGRADGPSRQHEEESTREVDISHVFAGDQPVHATFVVFERSAGWTVYNPERASERFIPASTFKIANTLIALETGVATDADFTITFDSTRDRREGFWTPEWSRDQTLRSAFQNSVYWYYQELARRVGADRMRMYLGRFGYGNQDMGGGVDSFWLEGDLRISPREQVVFLQQFHEGTLGVAARSTEILKDIMILDTDPHYVLRGKTGTADVTPSRELAWLVGYLESEGSVRYFALNMEGEEVWERWGPPLARRQLVISLFRELGMLPEP